MHSLIEFMTINLRESAHNTSDKEDNFNPLIFSKFLNIRSKEQENKNMFFA